MSRLLLIILLASPWPRRSALFVRHRHRQTFIELSRAERKRDDINLEFGRLQLEQATRRSQPCGSHCPREARA
jgi:cell division protein FtsL